MNQEFIGKFILNLRKKKKLTQQQFADILNVTKQAVSKWENGRGIPDIDLLNKMSIEFNIDIDEIIKGKKRKKSKLIPILIVSLIFIFGIIGVSIYIDNYNNDYVFSNLTTDSSNFDIKGIFAHSKDKKTIYISDITYVNEQDENIYTLVECSLFESVNNTIRKITSCEYNENSPTTLSNLLNNIEFKISNYTSKCSKLEYHNLYITIDAKDLEGNLISYQVPINLSTACKN